MQKLLTVLLYMLFSASAAQAGFFDDLFGINGNTAIKSYSIDIKDIDGADTIISHDEKVLKLRIFYPKAEATKIDELTNPQLKAAVKDALTVTSIDSETDDKTKLNNLNFAIRFKQVTTKSDQFYEMQFLSQGIVLDTPQRLDFSFNAKQFVRLLSLSTNLDEDSYTDSIYVKPIVIELVNPTIDTTNNSLDLASMLNGYSLRATLKSDVSDAIQTAVSIDGIAFTYKVNGKSKLATARVSALSKVKALTVSADSVPVLTAIASTSSYSLSVPVSIDASNLLAGKTYSARIPIQIETETASGLKVLLRGIAKGQIDTAPAQ